MGYAMFQNFGLDSKILTHAQWTLQTRAGDEISFWGGLTYDYEAGPVISARYFGDESKLRDDKYFSIVHSKENNLHGCTMLNAHVSNITHQAGVEGCDITITGTHIVTNYLTGFDEKPIFNMATLYYDNIDIFWNEKIIDSMSKKIDYGVIATRDEKTFFVTKFKKCKITLVQSVSISATMGISANLDTITRLIIESNFPLKFNDIYIVAQEANRCINFLFGNKKSFNKMCVRRAVESDDPIEWASKTSYVITNKFKKNSKSFLPVVSFREKGDSAEIVCKIFKTYEHYRESIISAMSAVEIEHDVSYQFFAMCRALESAFSNDRKRHKLSLACLLDEVDNYIFLKCKTPVGLKNRNEYDIAGLSKEISRARNATAHYNNQISSMRGNDFYEHYLLLKRCFYAYVFLMSEVSEKFVIENILRYQFLAE